MRVYWNKPLEDQYSCELCLKSPFLTAQKTQSVMAVRTSLFMLHRKITAVYSEIYTDHKSVCEKQKYNIMFELVHYFS